MKKKVVILLLVALMVVISAGPAMAAKKRTRRPLGLPGNPYFTMVGFVDVKDEDASSIDVDVIHGNRFSKQFIDAENATVEVDLHGGTEFRRWTPAGCVPSSWDAVDEGDTVSVHGYVVAGVFQANRVTIDVPLDCCTP